MFFTKIEIFCQSLLIIYQELIFFIFIFIFKTRMEIFISVNYNKNKIHLFIKN